MIIIGMSASLYLFILAIMVPPGANTIVWTAWLISLFINFE